MTSTLYYTTTGMPLGMSQEVAEKMAGEIVLSAEPGKTLRKWRDAFNISQQELSSALGRSPSIISDYEKGRRKSPGIKTLRRIVDSMLEIDQKRGSPVLQRFSKMGTHEAIFAIQEYPIGIPASKLIKSIEGKIAACADRADRDIYGYTVLDSLKAITSLSAFDYLRVYGWTSERAIVFTGVKYGRSPSIISDYEKGRRKSPGIKTLKRIVSAILEIDQKRGSPVEKRYSQLGTHEAIYAIQEFPIGIPAAKLIESIEGKLVACPEKMERSIYGFTVLDSMRAITSLSAFDYLRVFGWTSERAIVFTGVKYGRSPMVAIRSHPMKPAMVVFHKPERVDELAVRLAEIERIPLVTTDLHMDILLERLKGL